MVTRHGQPSFGAHEYASVGPRQLLCVSNGLVVPRMMLIQRIMDDLRATKEPKRGKWR